MPLGSINTVFNNFRDLNVLVIGDVMLDAYLWGSADRISPEAPVPVLKTKGKEYRLGGAANVALNIKSLGATPILCSVIGEDFEGNKFMEQLVENEIENTHVFRSSSRPTTVKTRVLSGYQHIVRIDSEHEAFLDAQEEKELLDIILRNLPETHVVIFEDYNKGCLTTTLISKVIEEANKLEIPTVVDPKKKNFLEYKQATVFKPNLKELKGGLNIHDDLDTIRQISEAVSQLQELMGVKEVFLTLSEKGVFFKKSGEEIHIPAHVRTISDVSGAGDTVISIIALCKALKLNATFTAELANLGGGLVCEHVGVVPVDKDELYNEAIKYDISSQL